MTRTAVAGCVKRSWAELSFFIGQLLLCCLENIYHLIKAVQREGYPFLCGHPVTCVILKVGSDIDILFPLELLEGDDNFILTF